ncbi:MAG: protein kinase [Acidobacteriia bacterium]|nr:protein kinase [Terriglobia bacterium]
MTPSRLRQIEAIFQAALERTENERTSFLEQACANDGQLRREVESLIAQHAARTNFLDQPAFLSMAAAESPVAITDTQIGVYKIQHQIGQGGMGVVFKALDTKLNRPVAVKLLSGRLVDAAARHRFQREAQMAASLNHPHIVTVYDTGEFAGCNTW